MRVGEVFVPGGFPEVTYVPRDELQLEERVRDYLVERFKVLSLSGPTKSERFRSPGIAPTRKSPVRVRLAPS
jgi:predicted RNA-binding protein